MKVLNYGSLNIDYTYSVDHFVRGGETLSSLSMQTFSGGKGLNQSIALSRGGAEVWHAGAVGKQDGKFLLKQLEDAGVHVELMEYIDGKTGHAMIQKDKNGQNSILLYGGANQEITKEKVDQVMEHFDKGDFLILQNEINRIAYIMEKAYAKGMKIVLNPSPMNEKIESYPLQYVDYFILNEIEAADICKEDGEGEALLKKLSEQFPKAKIVLTLGSEGSFYKDETQIVKQGIYKVPVVDTTGAGDTFTGFFIAAIGRGENPKKALEEAAKAAAIAVSRAGAAPSIPTREEVKQFSGMCKS